MEIRDETETKLVFQPIPVVRMILKFVHVSKIDDNQSIFNKKKLNSEYHHL